MKTTDYIALTPAKRASNLVAYCTKASAAKKELPKILIAAEECGDFGSGSGAMNAYAMKVTGVELRREAQGTYEACNVLRAIRANKIAMTEDEFDSKPFGSFPLIMLSGFLGKAPEKVGEALEIIRSGLDVTKRLQALRGPAKKSDAQLAKEKAALEAKEKAEREAAEKAEREAKEKAESEIQTHADSTTYVVPLDMAIMSHSDLMADLIAELKGAGTVEDCQTYLKNFDMLKAIVESRMEVLEFEAMEKAESAKQLAVA